MASPPSRTQSTTSALVGRPCALTAWVQILTVQLTGLCVFPTDRDYQPWSVCYSEGARLTAPPG